jgi:transcriptional regulator with XRE-family HTH domain
MQKGVEITLTSPTARELLAANIDKLRGELGYLQEELAHKAGLHRTFVAHVERRARNTSLDNVERLAKALNVQVHELLIAAKISS